jgi:hypothetical protein
MPQRAIGAHAADLLQREFAQEKATALGRLGQALESALAALSRLENDRQSPGDYAERQDARVELVAQASLALWHFLVQREVCGLRDVRHVLRDYRVPPEVVARVGAFPPGRPPGASPERAGKLFQMPSESC